MVKYSKESERNYSELDCPLEAAYTSGDNPHVTGIFHTDRARRVQNELDFSTGGKLGDQILYSSFVGREVVGNTGFRGSLEAKVVTVDHELSYI